MAFCSKCGARLEEGANFCRMCGAPVQASSAGYTQGTVPPVPSDRRSGSSTLVLIAMILQGIFTIILFFLLSFGLAAGVSTVSSTSNGVTVTNQVSGFPVSILAILIAAVCLYFAVWVALDYFAVYKPLSQGRVSQARTPCLVLGILQLIFAGFIPGILLIVAYAIMQN